MGRTLELQNMLEAVGLDLIEAAVEERDEPWCRINEVLARLSEEWTARLNAERALRVG